MGLQYFNEHSAVAGAESEEVPLCCVLGCSTRRQPGLLSADRPKTPARRTAPHAPVIFFCGEGDKVRHRCPAAHHSGGGLLPVLTPFYLWQLCKTCNSQLYNITASGHNKRTAELTDELRAQLGGMEYLLSTVVPRLGPQELKGFIASLTSSAAAALAGTALSDVMGQRPWARSAVYLASATRTAVRAVHNALVVAQTDARFVAAQGVHGAAYYERRV